MGDDIIKLRLENLVIDVNGKHSNVVMNIKPRVFRDSISKCLQEILKEKKFKDISKLIYDKKEIQNLASENIQKAFNLNINQFLKETCEETLSNYEIEEKMRKIIDKNLKIKITDILVSDNKLRKSIEYSH